MNNTKNLAETALVAVALIKPALSFESTTPVPINGNLYTVTNAWGLTGEHSMKYLVAPGTEFTLKNGVETVCPWLIPQGCYDLRWYYGS